jgi:hypothetical protein
VNFSHVFPLKIAASETVSRLTWNKNNKIKRWIFYSSTSLAQLRIKIAASLAVNTFNSTYRQEYVA